MRFVTLVDFDPETISTVIYYCYLNQVTWYDQINECNKHNHVYPNLYTNKVHSSRHTVIPTHAHTHTQYIYTWAVHQNLRSIFGSSMFFLSPLHVTLKIRSHVYSHSDISFTVRFGFSFAGCSVCGWFLFTISTSIFRSIMWIITIINFTALSHYSWVILSVAFLLFHSFHLATWSISLELFLSILFFSCFLYFLLSLSFCAVYACMLIFLYYELLGDFQ